MQPIEVLPQSLFDPTTAYLLFVLGLFAVFVEVAHPGALVPGAIGLLSLILAIAAFSALPVNLIGVMLIVASVGLMAVDVKMFGHGALTLVGVGCLLVGSLVLYSHAGDGSSLQADVTIATPVLVLVAVVGLALCLMLTRIAHGVRVLPPVSDLEQLVGARGVARTALAPDGLVHVNGQLWSARLRAGQIKPGHAIRVRARHGLVLDVESATYPGAATHKGASRSFH